MNASMTCRESVETPRRRYTWLDRWSRSILLRMLSGIREGCLTMIDGEDRHVFGRVTQEFPVSVTVTVHSPQLYRRSVLGGHIAMARGYAEGLWSCDNLTALIRIFVRQMELMDATDGGWARLTELLNRSYHWLRRNSRSGSRNNALRLG